MLGCDAREAYQQLAAAQDILRGKYMKDAESATRWINGLTVVKTASKVGLVVGATFATTGAGGATALGATGLWLGASDAVVDIGKTTATIIYGDDSKQVAEYERIFAPITTTATIFSILTFNTASAGEKLACLGDIKLWAEEKLGFTTEELTFNLTGGKLMMDILTQGVTKENFEKLISDPAFVDNTNHPKLVDATNLFNDGRTEITFNTLIDILDKGNVIEKGSTEDEYDALFDSFEEIAGEELAEKKEEETGEKITYHDDRRGTQYRNSYYTNSNGDYVGIREVYSNEVLTDVYYYDDDGNIVSRTTYDYKTGTPAQHGRITHYSEYTDGNNLGSIRTETQYYFEDDKIAKLPEGVTVQPHYVEQWITVPYYNENGERSGNTSTRYYGHHYEYNTDGVIVEHIYGNGSKWTNTDGFDKNGVLSYQVEDNGDGTHTVTYYFTANAAGYPFDPTGHKQEVNIYSDTDYGYSYNQSQYGNGGDFISGQKWAIGSDYEYIYDEEGENKIGYYKLYGYKYYPDSTNNSEYEFEEIMRDEAVYY